MDFVLIDLLAQRESVKQHVQGWTTDAILEWMSQYGEVKYNPKILTYAFRSNADGRFTAFRFSDKDELLIIR